MNDSIIMSLFERMGVKSICDTTNLRCPLPVLKLKRHVQEQRKNGHNVACVWVTNDHATFAHYENVVAQLGLSTLSIHREETTGDCYILLIE
jgi:hypothetical protein